MKLSSRLLVPAVFGAACAASEVANVYLFSGSEFPNQSTPPTLSPDVAALVIAERIGVSQYYNLDDATELTLSHINVFGGLRPKLFENSLSHGTRPQLVIMVDGAKHQPLSPFEDLQPAFKISGPSSKTSNKRFIADLKAQADRPATQRVCSFEEEVNPFISDCWNGPMNIIYLDLAQGSETAKLEHIKSEVIEQVKREILDVMVIVMPANSASSSSKNPYGNYDVPSSKLARRQAEEPMNMHNDATVKETSQSFSQISEPVIYANSSSRPALLPVCFATLKACTSATSNCSGHGECKLKYGSETETAKDKSACFACQCSHSIVHNKDKTFKTTYWGGPACSKQDVSGPFWLLAIFSVVMMGLVGWAIGMMFAIGEEKLPGVIGAGVSGPKAR